MILCDFISSFSYTSPKMLPPTIVWPSAKFRGLNAHGFVLQSTRSVTGVEHDSKNTSRIRAWPSPVQRRDINTKRNERGFSSSLVNGLQRALNTVKDVLHDSCRGGGHKNKGELAHRHIHETRGNALRTWTQLHGQGGLCAQHDVTNSEAGCAPPKAYQSQYRQHTARRRDLQVSS